MVDEADEGTSIPEQPPGELRADLAALRERVDEIEDRTLHRSVIEADLKRYLRARLRRGHARGWGPYLVLLYGTLMTVGAFHYLSGGWAILAMLVIWTSTLGVYVIMVLVGLGVSAITGPRRVVDAIRDRRS